VVLQNNQRTKIEDVQMRVSTIESVYGPYSLDSVRLANGKLPIENGQAVVAYLNMTHPDGTNDTINGTNITQVTIFPGVLVNNAVRLCTESRIDVNGPLNNCG
jgi:hypothetical protein